MALLSGRTTSGESAWEKYIGRNVKWDSMTLEIEKKITNVNLTQNVSGKLKSTDIFLNEGDSFILTSQKELTLAGKKYAQVKYNNTKGLIPTNKIRKPTGFDSVKDETIALENLDSMIKDIGYPIDIQLVGERKIYKNITGAKTIAGTPKADFACHDKFNRNQIFISHKKEGGAKAFQQYSGVTEKAGPKINQHPEVVDFMRIVSTYIEDGKLTVPVYRVVQDAKLINLAIFGPDYGGLFGTENCNLIGQGQAVIKPTDKDGLFTMSFDDHMALNGETKLFQSGDFKAILGATYRAGRGFVVDGRRFEGARLGIYPIDFISGRRGAVEI